jgi:hypothetical protein
MTCKFVIDVEGTSESPTCALTEFGDDHGCAWIPLRGLEDECVSCSGSHWNRPERDHPGEVGLETISNIVEPLTQGS